MSKYYRVVADNRDLKYNKHYVKGQVITEAEESYTSNNINLLDVDGVSRKDHDY